MRPSAPLSPDLKSGGMRPGSPLWPGPTSLRGPAPRSRRASQRRRATNRLGSHPVANFPQIFLAVRCAGKPGRRPARVGAREPDGWLSARRAAARSAASLGAMWLADAPSEDPVQDMRDLRRAGNGPHPAVGQLGYLLQLAEVLRHAEDDHQDLDRTAGADHRAQLA